MPKAQLLHRHFKQDGLWLHCIISKLLIDSYVTVLRAELGTAALLSSVATFLLAVAAAPLFFRPPATSGSAAVILGE